jgi:hypothetical protein
LGKIVLRLEMKPTLQKAIATALENGWDISSEDSGLRNLVSEIILSDKHLNEESPCYLGIIYNHNFAKALWPDGKARNPYYPTLYRWQVCLQQMVTSEDPYKYLEKNI